MRAASLVILIGTLCAQPALAQSSQFQAGIQAAASLRMPTQNPAAGVLHAAHSDPLAPRRFSSRAPGATLMIIGGAAIVAGILVNGSGSTVLILGGVVLGAYGLYLYTR